MKVLQVFNNSTAYNDTDMTGLNMSFVLGLIKTASKEYLSMRIMDQTAAIPSVLELDPLTGPQEFILYLVKQVIPVGEQDKVINLSIGIQHGRNGPSKFGIMYSDNTSTQKSFSNDNELRAYFGFIPTAVSVIAQMTDLNDKQIGLLNVDYIWKGTPDTDIDTNPSYGLYLSIYTDESHTYVYITDTRNNDMTLIDITNIGIVVAYPDEDQLISIQDDYIRKNNVVTEDLDDLTDDVAGKFDDIDESIEDLTESVNRIEGDQSNLFVSR